MTHAVDTDRTNGEAPSRRDRQHTQTFVYETLQERILAGEYESGERLTESKVVRDLGVSRTPVREALQRLAAEGFVEFHPNRGATVILLDEHDLEELFSLRILLEGFAAGLAAENATSADVGELRRLQDEFAQAVQDDSPEGRTLSSRINLRFHEVLLRVAGNRRLTTMVNTLTNVSLAKSTFASYSDTQLQRSVSQHDQIIEAIEHHDRNLAEMAMRVHINGARYSMIRELRTQPHAEHPTPPAEETHD